MENRAGREDFLRAGIPGPYLRLPAAVKGGPSGPPEQSGVWSGTGWRCCCSSEWVAERS